MYPFFESMALIDGSIQRIAFHQNRINRTFAKYYPTINPIELRSILIPDEFNFNQLQKLKLNYNSINYEINFSHYNPIQFDKFYFINDDQINYDFKYTDRNQLDYWRQQIEPHAQFIIIKNNLLTDSHFSNLVFTNGKHWITPKTPLHPGTMRAHLIDKHKIIQSYVSISTLHLFTHFKLINALNTLESAYLYPIELLIEPYVSYLK